MTLKLRYPEEVRPHYFYHPIALNKHPSGYDFMNESEKRVSLRSD